jgi:DNA-binding LacI/PurR family transcriptional regulator
MPQRRRPTAAFCANDLVALGLLQEMTRRHRPRNRADARSPAAAASPS